MKIKKFIKAIGATFLSVFAVVALVACSDSSAKDADEALARLSLLLDSEVEKSKESGLASNLELPFSVNVNHKEYVVTYTSNLDNAKVVKHEEDAENKTVVVEITQTAEKQDLTLTAEVAKKTKDWKFTIAAKDVSMLKTQAEIDAMENKKTYKEWAAAASGTSVLIQGWITHACDYRSAGDACVWLQDTDGGYYGYRFKCTQKDFNEYFKVGKKIALEGKVSPYGGWQELGSGGKYYVITDAEEKTFEFEDVTAKWKDHKATDKDAIAVQNKKVKVTAKITDVPEFSNSQMSIGLSVDGNEYTAFCKSNYFTIPNDFVSELKVGYTVEISGIAAVSSDKVQICPISADAIKIISTEVTAQDLVNGAVAEVKKQDVATTYYDSLTEPVTLLATTKEGCSVAYELKDAKGDGISLADGKLSVTVDSANASSATLVATITKEGAEKPATYEWKIVTKTDKDVMAELKKAVQDQDIKSSYLQLDARQRLLMVSSPSKKDAKVVYTLAENEYAKLGTIPTSGQQYFDIKKVPGEGEKGVQLELVATITYNETLTETVKFKFYVGEAASNPMIETKENVKVDQALFVKFTQGKVNKDYYLTGALDGYYLGTSEKMEEAKNFYLEAVEGGYYLYCVNAEGKKTYVNFAKSGNYTNAFYEAEAKSVWTFNETLKTFTTKVENVEYFLGTRNDKTYTTLGPVSDAENSFYVNFYVSTQFEANKEYVVTLNHTKNEKVYYLNGKMSSYYAATTENAGEALKFFFEKTEDGYYVYAKGEGDAKTYLSIIKDGTHINIKYLDKATTVWNYNVELNALTTVIDGTEYFMGTSNTGTFNTFGAVSADKAEKNFKAFALPAFGGGSEEPTPNPGEGADLSIIIKDFGLENAADFETQTKGDVTLTADLGTGQNTTKYYTSGEAVRIYGGNIFTISSTKKISKIVFEFAGSNAIKADVGTIEVGKMDYETNTWTGNENEIVIKNETTKTQIRIVKIHIFYAE